MKKIKLSILALTTSLMVFAFSNSASVAHADIADLTIQTGCTNVPSYTGLLNLKAGDYTAYVRLAKRGEHQTVASYSQQYGDYGNCHKLKTVKASGDSWTKVGTFRANGDTVVELAADFLKNIPNANRPAVMLLPASNPVCVPKIDCKVNINGEMGEVLPTSTLNNENSLRVFEVHDLGTDAISRVVYYVDNRIAYTKKTLEPFDMRYVTYPGQELKRVVVYTSGQRVAIHSTVSDIYQDSFSNFLFRTSQFNSNLFIGSVTTIALLVATSILMTAMKAVKSRRDWRIRHGFVPEPRYTISKKLYYALLNTKLYKVTRWLLIGLSSLIMVAAAIYVVNTYFLTIYTVDGVSMSTTYKTGDQLLINKFSKSLASANGKEYVPSRGDVVIVHAVFGTADSLNQNFGNLDLVKRVIGLPGERVVIKDGILTVYNKDYPNGFQPDQGASWQKNMTPDLKSESIDIQLGPSELFVCGDNRPESIDSRFNGPLSTKEIVGHVIANW